MSEADKIVAGLMADLPEQAQNLVAKVTQEITRLQEQADEKVANVRR